MNPIFHFFTEKNGDARKDLAFLLLSFSVSFFLFLGKFPLFEPDETRYAEIPREMLERGDFITPMLNYVKYFEKPPLHYWMNALSFTLFGRDEFAARFPGALCGLLGVLLTYHVGRTLFGRREGLISAMILGTSIGYLVQARINFTDMTLTFCLTASLGFFILAAREGASHKGWHYHLFYLCAALAVLAKGLIGIVLPGAIIFLYFLLGRRWSILKEMRLPTGILLFLLVSAPWFILVSHHNPEFPRFFFIHEHFERFLTKVHGRYKPFWFFIPVLVGCMLPWSFFIPAGLRRAWQERRTEGADARLFLFLWAVVIFAFFSKSNSKLIPYILPVFPPFAILIGSTFSAAWDGAFKPLKIQAYVVAVTLTIMGTGLLIYPHLAPNPALSAAGGGVLGLILMGEGIFALRHTYASSTPHLFIALCLFSYTFGIVGPSFIFPKVVEKKSLKELGLLAKKQAENGAVVASYGLEQGLPYYTERRVIIVGGRGEVEFGSLQGDQSAWFMDLPRFTRLWDSQTPVILLIKGSDLPEVQRLGAVPPRILATQGRKILVTNR